MILTDVALLSKNKRIDLKQETCFDFSYENCTLISGLLSKSMDLNMAISMVSIKWRWVSVIKVAAIFGTICSNIGYLKII